MLCQHIPYTHLLTQVRVEFTQPLYNVSEDVGNAPVALTLTQGDAERDRDIMITVNSTDFNAIGK